jgi:hypothetical protein
VHQHDGGASLGDHGAERRVELEAADVVDEGRAACDSLTRNGRLVGVDADDRAGRREPLDDRQHAPQLLVVVQRVRAGARGLAADVQDVGAILDHPQAVVHGPFGIVAEATVRKRVGRHVDDAHDQRARAELERPAARQGDRVVETWVHEKTAG